MVSESRSDIMSRLKSVHPFIYMCAALALCLTLMPSPVSVSKSSSFSVRTSGGSDIEVVPYVNGHIGHAANAVQQRPTIYTFFARIHPENKITGMTDEDDTVLLAKWSEYWQKAGWDTEILTLKHAKKHPRYEEFLVKLQNIPLNEKNRVYNEICYLRWLAMAVVGGGWMSDYDMMPLGYASGTSEPQPTDLPNDGAFTVYSIIPGSRGAGIPCLMSGTPDEWTRMAFNVLDDGMIKSQTETHWTDMYALMDLRWAGDLFQYADEVVAGDNMLIGRDWKKQDCQLTTGKRAVHFSHSAMKNGIVTDIKGASNAVTHRPIVLDHWLKMWKKVCGHA